MLSLRLSISACLAIAVSASMVFAQTTTPEAAAVPQSTPVSQETAKPPAPVETTPPATKGTGGTVLLKGQDGKSVEVPADATLDKFLEWLRLQRGEAFDVSNISIDGTADEIHANLTVTVTVIVHRENEWVEVPLGLNEAVLQEEKHSGVGEFRPVIPFSRESGYRRRLRGKGEHRLVLRMVVPITKNVATRRMVLSLPATAVSQMKLNVPVALDRLLVKSPKAIVPRRTAAGKEATQIELYGLGTVLDLQWEAVPESARIEPILQSQTSIVVGPTGESLLLEATQNVSAVQGTFSELIVTLPSGFQLLKVKGKEYRDRKILAPNRVAVQLNEATGGPVELNWLLERKYPLENDRLTLQGFTIENSGVREQEGTIAIKPFEGFRVSRSEGAQDNAFVRRVDVSDVMPSGKFMSAYSFQQQPFRLVLSVTELEPSFNVEPRLLITLSPESAELNATYHFDVLADSGTVKRVEFQWPNRGRQSWEIESVQIDGVDGRIEYAGAPNEDLFNVPLEQPRTGSFDVSLKARRRIPSGGEKFELTLPRAEGTRVSPAVLLASGNENVVFTFEPVGATSVERLSKAVLAKLPLPEEVRVAARPNYQDYLVLSSEQLFQAGVTVHQQSIQAETTATIELKDQHALITQRMSFDVAYERLNQIEVTVPADISDTISFSLNEDRASDDNGGEGRGVLLVPIWTSTDPKKPRTARVTLPEARLGAFDIVARFVVPLSGELSPENAVALNVPLVESSATPFANSRIRFRNHDQVAAEVKDESWKEQVRIDDIPTWTATKRVSTVPLLLKYEDSQTGANYRIGRSLIRTTVDRTGVSRSVGQYWIDGPVKFLFVTMPVDISPERFWWNKTKLTDAAVKIPDGSRRYRLDLSGVSEARQNLLTIEFHERNETPLSWYRSSRLSAPIFPSNVWLDESIWELILPADQHLFQPPQGFTPRFRWVRDSIFWHRRAEPQYADLSRWISSDKGPDVELSASEGNAYAFSRFGAPPPIELSAMSEPVIVLIGAGLALAAGFVLLKIPQLRSVLTAFVLCFIVALLGLWYEAPIKLLLQPAGLGLLLSVAAVLIDGMVKKHKTTTLIPISSPSDFVLPSASSFSEGAPSTGSHSDVPTALRHTALLQQEPVSSADMGHSP